MRGAKQPLPSTMPLAYQNWDGRKKKKLWHILLLCWSIYAAGKNAHQRNARVSPTRKNQVPKINFKFKSFWISVRKEMRWNQQKSNFKSLLFIFHFRRNTFYSSGSLLRETGHLHWSQLSFHYLRSVNRLSRVECELFFAWSWWNNLATCVTRKLSEKLFILIKLTNLIWNPLTKNVQ